MYNAQNPGMGGPAPPPPPGGVPPPADVNTFVNTPPSGSTPFVREIRGRLDAYFKLVIRNTRDAVPKAIGHFLVRKMQDTLQFELYNQLASADKMSELLGEPPHIVEERRSPAAERAAFCRRTSRPICRSRTRFRACRLGPGPRRPRAHSSRGPGPPRPPPR